MTHWPFIAAAYAVTLIGMVALVAASYVSMRRAEAEADALRAER